MKGIKPVLEKFKDTADHNGKKTAYKVGKCLFEMHRRSRALSDGERTYCFLNQFFRPLLSARERRHDRINVCLLCFAGVYS